MMMTVERREQIARAIERAKAVLKPGDSLFISRCGGIRKTVTMTGWDGMWITSKTLDDISAISVLKVNGKAVDFMQEPPWTPSRPTT